MKKCYLLNQYYVKLIATLIRRTLLPLLFIGVLNYNQAEAADEITIGYFTLAPHVISSETRKQPSGAAFDFFEKYIKPELNEKVKWNQAPVSRVLLHIKEGIWDAALLMAKRSGREKFAYYPKYPYWAAPVCLIVMKDHPLTQVKIVEDILEYKIGHVLGSIKTPFMRDPRIRIEYLTGSQQVRRNLKLLDMGRLDAVYHPECSSAFYVAGQIGMREKIRSVYLPENKMKLFTIFSKKSPKGQMLLETYNRIMAGLIKDRSADNKDIYMLYDNLLKQYIE